MDNLARFQHIQRYIQFASEVYYCIQRHFLMRADVPRQILRLLVHNHAMIQLVVDPTVELVMELHNVTFQW